MPKFLLKGSYTAEGMRGLKKDKASGRETAVTATVKALGGKVEGIWYALGDDDAYLVIDLPSHVHAAALATNISATGMINTSTTALLTVAEMDQALSEKVTYRAPGA
jgi:uncharacterized protein with GYD domain